MTSGGMTLVCLGAMLGPPVADAVDTTSDASEASAAESTSRAAGDGPGRRRAALDGRWWALELQPGLAVPLGGQLGRMDGQVGFSGRVIALRNRAWRGFYLATGPVLHYAFFRRDDDAVRRAFRFRLSR